MIKTENYLRELAIIFFAQQRIIFTVMVALTLAGVAIAFLWPSSYAVECSILVKSKKLEKSPEALEAQELRLSELTSEDLRSEMQLIESPDVLRATVEALKKRGLDFTHGETGNEAMSEAVDFFAKHLELSIVPKAFVIKVVWTDSNVERGVAILKTLLDVYIRYRSSVFNPTSAEGFFKSQRDNFSDTLQEHEQALTELYQTINTPTPDQEMKINMDIVRDIKVNIEGARREILDLRKLTDEIKAALDSNEVQLFSFVDNPSIVALSSKLQELLIKRSDAFRVYTDESPQVKRVDEQINQVFGVLQSEVDIYYNNLKGKLEAKELFIETATIRINELTQRNLELQSFQSKVDKLQTEIKMLKHSYETFFRRFEESRMAASPEANNLFSISVLNQPFSSGVPVFPRKLPVLVLSLFVGLLAGVSIGFLQEFFDHTFKTPRDVTVFAGLPTLFSISADSLALGIPLVNKSSTASTKKQKQSKKKPEKK